jgi:catechol 2,3-dioxygenase-like lactoylglutathione lyase family enzyme
VTIACTDQKRSERFYEGVLGAKRLPGDGYGCSWFQLGALTFNLMPNAAEPSPAEFPAHAMPILWLEVDDLDAAHRHLKRREAPILELHEGQFLMAADPDGLLIEVWQSATERFECIAGPDLNAECGPVRVTLFGTPFLRSARTGAVKPIEDLRMGVDDEPYEGDFAQFVVDAAMFRCGSYEMKLKEHLPRVFYQCRVCQAMLPEEPGAPYLFEIDLKLLEVPTFYLQLEAPAVVCPRCERHMILSSNEARERIRQAVSDALSGLPESGEGSSS